MSTPRTWTPAGPDHELCLDGIELLCRKTSGRILASVPKAVKSSVAGQRFVELRDRLLRHQSQCRSTVESWLLGDIPVPSALLAAVWPDPIWRDSLTNLVVTVGDHTGLLAGIDDTGQYLLVLPGDTTCRVRATTVRIVHPVLLSEPLQWRQLLWLRQSTQPIAQLDRQTHPKPADLDPTATGIDDYRRAHFTELRHATSLADQHGYRVRGGYAVTSVTEAGTSAQARYWLGAGDPTIETATGRLVWVDDTEHPIALGDLGPVAWSEGVAMAAIIYAGRTPDGQ